MISSIRNLPVNRSIHDTRTVTPLEVSILILQHICIVCSLIMLNAHTGMQVGKQIKYIYF